MPEDVPKNQGELERVSPDIARQDQADEYPFSVDISPEIGQLEIGMDKEDSNQYRVYELRKLFEVNPQLREYSWIPQAVEAMARSTQTDLGDYFGRINGLDVDTREGIVRVRIEGASIEAYEISITELSTYSLELIIDGLDSKVAVPSINYSPEMDQAVASLSDDARYRWGLITRAAVHKSVQGDIPLTVAHTTKGSLTKPPSGVGVFIRTGQRRDLFSAIKVSEENLPLTNRERKIMEFGRILFEPSKSEDFKDVLGLVKDFAYRLKQLFGFPSAADFSFEKNTIDDVPGVDESTFELFAKLDKLAHAIMDHEMDAGVGNFSIPGIVLDAKSTYKEESPFELAGLPNEVTKPNGRVLDLADKVGKARESLGKLIGDAVGLFEESKDVLLGGLAEADDASVERAFTGMQRILVPRVREEIKEASQILSTLQIDDLRDQAGRLAGDPAGQVFKIEGK